MEKQDDMGFILERLREAEGDVTPAEIVKFMHYLSSLYARLTVELCDTEAKCALLIGEAVKTGVSVAQAKSLTDITPEGQAVIKLKGRVKAVDQLLMTLKKTTTFQSNIANNRY